MCNNTWLHPQVRSVVFANISAGVSVVLVAMPHLPVGRPVLPPPLGRHAAEVRGAALLPADAVTRLEAATVGARASNEPSQRLQSRRRPLLGLKTPTSI